jgi:flagellar biosynthesis protein FlhB
MSEDKRHAASHHKLSEARKRGEIAYSKDLTGAAGFVCGLVAAWATNWRSHLDVLMTLAVKPVPAGSPVYLLDRTLEMMAQGIWLAAPALVAAAVGGLVMAILRRPHQIQARQTEPGGGIQAHFLRSATG